MIYHIHEMTKSVLMSYGTAARVQSTLLKNPLNPLAYTPYTSDVIATCTIIDSMTKRYTKPKFNLDTTICDGKTVGVTEEIVHRMPFGQLKRFARNIERPDDPKVLIVVPMSGHFATLLRDTIETLLPEHDVYITDWRDARSVPLSDGDFGLDDYVDYIIEFLYQLGKDTHLMAVCQPVVPALAAVAIMSEQDHSNVPKSLTLMSGPIDASIDPTEPCNFARKYDLTWFKNNLIHTVPSIYKGSGRKVYPGFFQLSAFISMNPDKHFNAYKRLYRDVRDGNTAGVEKHQNFYNEYLAVMDLSETFYLDTIKRVFQEFHLARGCFYHRGRLVDLSAITETALMTVEGENDDISSPGQTRVAHDLCVNIQEFKRLEHLQSGAGHYGVFSGSKWRKEISPVFKKFIRSI